MTEDVKIEIMKRLDMLPGKIGFYYRNLVTGEEMSRNPDEPMLAASVIKLFIMAEAYRQIADGILDKDLEVTVRREDCVPSCGALNMMHDGIKVTVEDLYTLMIILSDNSATNYMIDILGLENIQNNIRALGYTHTQLNRKLYDEEKEKQGIQNYITAGEVGDLFVRMAKGTLVSREASDDMIRILKEQRLNGKIPFYLEALPEEPEIAHKTGEDTGITHDAGIIYAGQPFVAVFCCNDTDVPECERMMAELSLLLYNENNC